MSSTSTQQPTILITGANRGQHSILTSLLHFGKVGLGLAQSYHSEGYKVIAGIRDPSKAPKLEGLIAVKIDAGSRTDAKEAVEELRNKYGIEKLDIVIANAGISEHYAKVKDIDIDQLQQNYSVNAQGPLVLFQAVYSLLKEGSNFVVVSTGGSSNTLDHIPTVGAYAASKSAINFLTRQIHFEEPHITSFFFSPGWLDTHMGNFGASTFGYDETPQKLSETLPQMVKLIDNATREEHSGLFWNYDGTKIPF